jgi:hypothetical protein
MAGRPGARRTWLAAALAAGCGAPTVTPVTPPDARAVPVVAAADAAVAPADAFFVPPPTTDAEIGPAPGAAACSGSTTATPASCAALGVTVDPFYASRYTCYDLGPVPGVPAQKYGGLTLTLDRCSTTLLIGGEANQATGKLYAVPVGRDAAGHVSAFLQPGTVRAEAPYNDGGITFGPAGVLFFTRWPSNQLQETRAGSAAVDRVIDLAALGVAQSAASLAFVPAGLPSAGALKLVSWSGGQWYTAAIRPAQDTFDVTAARLELTLPGGPEGFVYVAAGSPLFDTHSLLVSEWTGNQIATYQVDDGGNPRPGTRRTFISGLRGAEGATRDPATGDFFFSTWGQSADRVIVVRGFVPIIE